MEQLSTWVAGSWGTTASHPRGQTHQDGKAWTALSCRPGFLMAYVSAKVGDPVSYIHSQSPTSLLVHAFGDLSMRRLTIPGPPDGGAPCRKVGKMAGRLTSYSASGNVL